MKEGDGETWFCYYCVMKLHWKPQDYLSLSYKEKILMKIFIEERLKSDEASRNKLKQSTSYTRRRR